MIWIGCLRGVRSHVAIGWIICFRVTSFGGRLWYLCAIVLRLQKPFWPVVNLPSKNELSRPRDHCKRCRQPYAFNLSPPAASSIESLIRKLIAMLAVVLVTISHQSSLTCTTARLVLSSLDATSCAHQCCPSKAESRTTPCS